MAERKCGRLPAGGLLLWLAVAGCGGGADRAETGSPQGEDAPGLALVDGPAAAAEAGQANVASAVGGDSADLSKYVPLSLVPYAAGSTPATTRTGEDWPQFLGPRDTGISGETGLVDGWSAKGPPVLWEKSVGTGYSAPSVRGNRLVLHHRLDDEEIVECFTADTGEPVWKYAYRSDFRDPYGYNNGPRCSPLLTADRCYTFGAEGRLLCLDLKTGKHVWHRDTGTDWQVPEAFFGVGSSPILHGQLLIVMVGGLPRSGMVAFNVADGSTVWQSVGKGIWKFPEDGYETDNKLASYASPIAATFHGRRHVLAVLRDGLVSVDPQDGRVQFAYFFRSRSFESVNAARPVVVDDKIFLSAAYRTGAALLRVQPDGNGVEELWRNRNMETHWSTTILHDGHLFGFSGRHEPEGTLRCLDLKTGEIVWETEGAGPDAPFNPKDGLGETESRYYGRGSAILADGKFIVLGERGLLALVAANPKEFQEIARHKFPQMNYPSWAAPVLSRGRLYLRDEDHLLCIDLAKPKG